nr:hypothetical protein [Nocardia sp. alder85J]
MRPPRRHHADLEDQVDPGVRWSGATTSNDTPLLVNTVGSSDHRPDAHCAVSNLFFGGDHVRTSIDPATMEGANESGRGGQRRHGCRR